MGLNKKTPKESMKYWAVGWNPIKIKARTARVAVRKWMRDNLAKAIAMRDSCQCCRYDTEVSKEHKKKASAYDVKDIPVKEWNAP